ncbi:MAG: methylenetetrahydromethanopterin dehydrogenase [Candidatus Methanomethylicota archaeon]|uniref:Methylenetetrahydromethanopterin dehydrogenase n=1 Tax=Thermoproteota archaeon TaxID=2056631 RepID=A0A497ENN8_9CREN|nr:MAG: methylenetetrahydromethanopterin dehydrogenase [Candidatus Verstraetearchaeota archaeon]RLE52568.1 MAG: methylenetetrahydromethanopterin dehydrogenase [Candidatus Verstraetearchaeota archaeon]
MYKNVMIFLSTDKYPSPFDMLIMYDAGVDHVIYYGEVTPDKAKQLILDAMFPRGPKGVKHTKLFIGGNDVKAVEEIAKIAEKTMFPPFEMSIIVDPQGGYTTAAALLAKVKAALKKHFNQELKGVNAVVLAATGVVGRSVSLLLAREGASVSVCSRSFDKARQLADELNSLVGGQNVKPSEHYPQDIYATCRDADVVIATGAPGVQLLPKSVLEKLTKCKVVADANAVPPTGIEGLNPNDDEVKLANNIIGIGALAAGFLKFKVEVKLIQRALEASKGVFALDSAYSVANEILGL